MSWRALKGPKENRPKDGQRCLFCTKEGWQFTGTYHKDPNCGYYWVKDDRDRCVMAECWMPLPESRRGEFNG